MRKRLGRDWTALRCMMAERFIGAAMRLYPRDSAEWARFVTAVVPFLEKTDAGLIGKR